MSSSTLLFIEISNASMNTVRPECIHSMHNDQMLGTVFNLIQHIKACFKCSYSLLTEFQWVLTLQCEHLTKNKQFIDLQDFATTVCFLSP